MKLGSPKSTHTAEGKRAVAKIERDAESLSFLAKAGRCTAATIAYAEMHNSVGQAEAHMSSGGTVWNPTTTIQEASYLYNEHCVRESRILAGNLGGKRRRRRR